MYALIIAKKLSTSFFFISGYAGVCYDSYEDISAPITLAKKFGFLAGVVSKVFAIGNALQ